MHRIIIGDAAETLRALSAESAQCCVTSPPYFGLRDYGAGSAEVGREASPDEYVARLVEVFREVRRVLRPDGVAFLNLGDSYAGAQVARAGSGDGTTRRAAPCAKALPPGFKPKDLLMIPARVALALQADGWFLRSAIVWSKPNPMPESTKDRPTSAYEFVFLLAKSARYFWDADAIRERCSERTAWTYPQPDKAARAGCTRNGTGASTMRAATPDGRRNARNVQHWMPARFAGAHFATMPPDMAAWCIKAGTRPGDTVLDPFGGAGTTALAARDLGRDAVLVELNPDYAALAEARLAAPIPPRPVRRMGPALLAAD